MSVEHIVPESLGNVDHVLRPKWVCDTCNNYFAREVEQPFLDTHYGRSLRFRRRVPNKRGRYPRIEAYHLLSRNKLEMSFDNQEGLSVYATDLKNEETWIPFISRSHGGRLFVPSPDRPNEGHITSRFIGKVGIEALAERCCDVEGCNDELVDHEGLDALRDYVRVGSKDACWPTNIRRIYPEDEMFSSPTGVFFQVLHEWTLLYTPTNVLYAVIALFGLEFTINLGAPEIDGCAEWLEANNHRSPLLN